DPAGSLCISTRSQIMSRIARISGIAVLGLSALAIVPAFAQSQAGQQQSQAPSATQQQQQDFYSDQLQSFVDASSSINDIRQSASQELQQAGDEQDREQIRKQAQSDMINAIKDAGLTLEQYNEIGRAAQSNPELAQKLRQM